MVEEAHLFLRQDEDPACLGGESLEREVQSRAYISRVVGAAADHRNSPPSITEIPHL